MNEIRLETYPSPYLSTKYPLDAGVYFATNCPSRDQSAIFYSKLLRLLSMPLRLYLRQRILRESQGNSLSINSNASRFLFVNLHVRWLLLAKLGALLRWIAHSHVDNHLG